MAFSVIDRVVDTTTLTGTGNVTCAGAVAGYLSFNSVTSGGETFYYLIEAVDGAGVPTGDFEIGLGATVSRTPFVFSRNSVISSSNSGAAVSFTTGAKRVHLIAPAAMIGLLAGVAKRSTSLTAQNFTTSTAISWDANQFDLGPLNPFHEGITHPTRLTIPADYGDCYVRLFGSVSLNNIAANETVNLSIRQTGSGDVAHATFQTSSTSPFYQLVSQIMLVSAGDYFELMLQTSSDTSIDILSGNGSRFQIEVLQ